jgi:hypothetical protein
MIGEEASMAKTGDGPNRIRPRKSKTSHPSPAFEPVTSIEKTAQPTPEASPTRTLGRRRPFAGFDRERAAYERLKPALIASAEGKYVVIVGDEAIGPLQSHEDAEAAGYLRFGLGPLYVKQVLAKEPVVEITRFHAP